MEFHCCQHFCAPLARNTHTSRSIQILWKQCQFTSQPIVSVVFFSCTRQRHPSIQAQQMRWPAKMYYLYGDGITMWNEKCMFKETTNSPNKRIETMISAQIEMKNTWNEKICKFPLWKPCVRCPYVNASDEYTHSWVREWVSECNAARNCSSKMWKENKKKETKQNWRNIW